MEETPDADLVQLIRTAAPAAEQAEEELRGRHLPAALVYARLCGRDGAAAGQLAAEAWRFAVGQVREGGGGAPAEAWRLPLLLLVERTARDWAADGAAGGRRAKLAPAFVAALVGRAEPGAAATRRAYQALPERTRAVLWHTVVERERDAPTAALLGIETGALAAARARALDRLRGAYLEAHTERGGEDCRHFSRMIDAAARGSGERRSADLEGHLAACQDCTGALTDLTALDERPGVALAEALLPWGGSAYVAARLSGGSGAENGGETFVPAVPTGTRRWSRMVPVAAALALSAVVCGFLMARQDSAAPTGSGAAIASSPTAAARPSTPARGGRSAPPRATVTATTTVTATRTATTTATPRPGAPSSSGPPSGDTYAQLVNAGTGMCLDVEDSVLREGTDVVAGTCSAATTQKWFLDGSGLLHNDADPALCLDSRGGAGAGAVISSCADASDAGGADGGNQVFQLAGDGTLRPRAAPGLAVTPGSAVLPGRPVRFTAADGRDEQSWRRGEATVRRAA